MPKSVRQRHHRRSPLERPGNPLNVHSNRDLVYSHSLTHAPKYQKGVGKAQARREHAEVVRIMKKRGFHHDTPFR